VITQGFCTLILGCLLAACVSIHVESLSQQHYPARPSSEPIEVINTEPTLQHVKLARIIATSESASEDRLKDKILARARELGADAVVLGQADVIETMGSGSPFQDTMGATGSSNSLFGGWWSPFYLDPWTYAQAGTDQTTWTMYMSGVAIKFLRSDPPQAAEGKHESASVELDPR
jgi:hypothetical protein